MAKRSKSLITEVPRTSCVIVYLARAVFERRRVNAEGPNKRQHRRLDARGRGAPLWEGTDATFAAYAQTSCSIRWRLRITEIPVS
jgi:hypothetical protein